MSTTAIILLSVHLVFSIICGFLVWRAYGRQSSCFFKGFAMTFVFGFIGALYFLKNMLSEERGELLIAGIVAWICILLARTLSFLSGYRMEFLLLAMLAASILHGIVYWKKHQEGHWLDCINKHSGTYMMSFISTALVALVLFICPAPFLPSL